ncbi:Rap1-interacting factor 1 N terminal-domain-containing protein [Xylaria sp. FL0043]|nr:Rap1-interacting factor 1 N terminal-domain-containing protein [Xylaria sp. FL0043]
MVSPVAAPSAGLDALLARPPTPPRERQRDLDPASISNRHPLASRLTLQTPPGHSPSSALSTNNSSRRSGKRVEFTVHAEYRDPPTDPGKENEHKQSTPISGSSSMRLSRPLKSILKLTSSPNPPNPLDPSAGYGEAGSTTTLATMLESSVKQLASNDRDSKIDAYTMLVRALKTSTNLPDRIALQSKMSLFVQFIQRDVNAKGGNGAIDSSLVNHSLNLLSTFLHFPAIATTVSSDFGVFIIDHCIRSFEDPMIPKDVIRHLMQVVVCQDFPPKVMTADRVGRLVASLHSIENHMKGKSIIMSRILIYRRLIKQSTIHMVSHSDWLMDLFTDMLSSLKEIRSAAIALGLEASFTAAKERQLSKKVKEVLQMSVDETCFVEYYIQRLRAMSREKSEMAAVPQIWSVVILLLRSPIDRWEFFDQWLEIIQRCFNSGDYQTKLEANYAWNRLVYVMHLHESSFSKTIGTLCQPFNQLKRRGKQPQELRKVVIGGLCNIYYYAFKPNSSSTHVDHYWDACVRTLVRTLAFPETDGKLAEKQHFSASDNIAQAADILAGLFDSSTVRLWKEDRIAENPLAKPTDLPPLDPKWIRRNTGRVFNVVEPILCKSFLDLADPETNSSKLWKSLISAVAVAASKEVKVSIDTAAFLGNALSLLMRIWTAGLREATSSADMQQLFLKAVEAYLTTMISSIGQLPFTEKLLSMNEENTLVPIATPSHRSRKGNGSPRSPLHHLFSILSSLPLGISDTADLPRLFKRIFGPFMLTRSLRGRTDLAHELMQIPPPDGPINSGPWVFIAEILSTPGEYSQPSNSSSDSASQSLIGQDLRDIVRHLEKGIDHIQWPQWLSLFQFVAGQATELSGEAGCSLAIVEPLAKAVLQSLAAEANVINPNVYRCGIQLISNAKQPRDRQALDAARRRLWGTTVAGARSASFDPFDNLYRLLSRLLTASYTNIDSLDEDTLTALITETSHFLSRANRVLVFKSLVQLQQGLAPWIQDMDRRYGSKQRSMVAEAVKLLWDRICNLFSDTTLAHFQLDAIEQLLCCAFNSKHRYIVNNAVLLWNRSFDSVEEVNYPMALKNVLLSLRSYAEITLPGLDNSNSAANDAIPLFVESQDDLEVVTLSNKLIQRTDPPSSSGCLETPRPKQIPQSAQQRPEDLQSRSCSKSARSTRSTRSTRSATRNRTPKPRHDDSQIQFATIEEPSPSDRAAESQVLTDRQKEVRERQQENAVLFPSIRSGCEKDEERPAQISHQTSLHYPNLNQSPIGNRSVTPRATRSYDYVSSTPTPRRGQHSIIDEDQEMTDDLPSSPPEPRRNLLPEMKSHSRDTRMLDDIPISSSPISGSPVSKISPGPQLEHSEPEEGITDITIEPRSSQNIDHNIHDPIITTAHGVSMNYQQQAVQDGSIGGPIIQQPEIPDNVYASKAKGTPKSEGEVFVDALTSPTDQGLPARGNTTESVDLIQDDEYAFKDRSFELSDGEERSMARLVIELDSRKCDPLPNYDVTSPQKAIKDKHTMECITVHTGPEQPQQPLGKNLDSPSTPLATSVMTSDDSQQSEKRSKKRKRASDRKQNSIGKKRKHMQANREDTDTVMDDEDPTDGHQTLPRLSDSEQTEAGKTIRREEPHDGVPLAQHSQRSPDLSCDPGSQSAMESLDLGSDGSDSDTAAVNLQLITEASQQSEADGPPQFVDDETSESDTSSAAEVIVERGEQIGANEMDSQSPEERSTSPKETQSAVERIAASLRDGLEGLRMATLSREDVYKIEDMFMDIKKELYEAERRSRR